MRIERVRESYENELMQLPNVVGIGIGEKDGHPVIKVFVTQKVEITSLSPEQVIPKRLSNFPVVVEELGKITASGE